MKLNSISSINYGCCKPQSLKKVAKAAETFEPDFSKSAYAVPTGLVRETKVPTSHDYFAFSTPTDTPVIVAKPKASAVESYEYLSNSMEKNAGVSVSKAPEAPEYISASTIIE